MHPEWLQTMTVTLRDMSSRDFITAGSTLRILAPGAGRGAVRQRAPS